MKMPIFFPHGPLNTMLVDESGGQITLPDDRPVSLLILQTRYLFQAPGSLVYTVEHTCTLEEI